MTIWRTKDLLNELTATPAEPMTVNCHIHIRKSCVALEMEINFQLKLRAEFSKNDEHNVICPKCGKIHKVYFINRTVNYAHDKMFM